ncbi:thioredoxin-like protein [Penicillium taxi]|uniref:thioredoxin-like protein n=1 Tax=Penicillium taxi TaxID=168475 RepID=UPI002545960F|nr:thioredoxin-like protein [Penicillium taxi]KAJ5893602.1 thioredoxin-like protein [Penicillium taxi]
MLIKPSTIRFARLPVLRASSLLIRSSPLKQLTPAQSPFRAFSSTPIPKFTQSFKMAGGNVIQINTAAEWKTLVEESTEPILVDFFAEWCGPCKAISPKIEELSVTHEGALKVYKVDVDQLQEVAADNGVSAMPTFFFYKNGAKVQVVRGANPPAILAGVKTLLE